MKDEGCPPGEENIEITRAQYEIEWRTRKVAANMLRIIAGAGRPFDLFEQMRKLKDAIGSVPPDTLVGQVTDAMVAALVEANTPHPTDDFERPMDTMERGALRKAASRILGQTTQMAAGDRLMWEGFRDLEKSREENRRKWEAERPQRRPTMPKKRRRTPVAKKPAPTIENKPAEVPTERVSEPPPGTTAEFMRARAKAIERGER